MTHIFPPPLYDNTAYVCYCMSAQLLRLEYFMLKFQKQKKVSQHDSIPLKHAEERQTLAEFFLDAY